MGDPCLCTVGGRGPGTCHVRGIVSCPVCLSRGESWRGKEGGGCLEEEEDDDNQVQEA